MDEMIVTLAILNRIFWTLELDEDIRRLYGREIAKQRLADKIAIEATEALDYLGYIYHTIYWNKETETFEHKIRN